MTAHVPPRDCPVCGDRLALTRLSCQHCGTEVSGTFEPCAYCALDADSRELLRVFLGARGNTKEIQRRLGVSYPTARARISALLTALGLGDDEEIDDEPDDTERLELLEQLARGEVDVDDALDRLG